MKIKSLNLLGLAQRAGKVISGDFIVEKAIKRKDPKLVLLAGDCAANNEKKYTQLAEDIKFHFIVLPIKGVRNCHW